MLCLKYLVEKAKADIRMVTKRGQSLVHAACLNGHVDIVEWLFTILDRSFVCQQTRDAATPFHCAACIIIYRRIADECFHLIQLYVFQTVDTNLC